MSMRTWFRRAARRVHRGRRCAAMNVETLDGRQLLSVGLGFVGLAKAPASEMTYLASEFKSRTGEVEVSFLPFEFNPSNPFGNATKLVQETLPQSQGKLRLTVDLEWFVHSSGDSNGRLNDGGSAYVYGRQAQHAFWNAWESYNPRAQTQPRPITDFLNRVHQADAWVSQVRTWAVNRGLQDKIGVTFVPVLEDEFATQRAYTNLVNAIRAEQTADHVSPTHLRRSKNGDNSANFRISGVSMEWHGDWSSVRGLAVRGDTWSNDGTPLGDNDFVTEGQAAKAAGVSALYWNGDMNGTPKTDTNWASRTVNPFSGPAAAANKARLRLVLAI